MQGSLFQDADDTPGLLQPLLTIPSVAKMLAVSRPTVYTLINHDGPSDNPHMLHSNKMIQFLPLASLPWQPDSFLEPTFLLAYHPQSRGRRPTFEKPCVSVKISCGGTSSINKGSAG